MNQSIGWSNFARSRHTSTGGYSYYKDSDEALFKLIRDNWESREAGSGTVEVDDVCVVHVPAGDFYCPLVEVGKVTSVEAEIATRRDGEESHVKVVASGPATEAKFVKIILYSAEAIVGEGEERAGDYDWEIISVMAGLVKEEPMHPLTMARNQLGKDGGSQREYTSDEWAEAVWYWSQHVMRKV